MNKSITLHVSLGVHKEGIDIPDSCRCSQALPSSLRRCDARAVNAFASG
jgi:hypothetical protein